MTQLRTLAAAVALTVSAGLATAAVAAPAGNAAPVHQAAHAKKKPVKKVRAQRVQVDLLPPISGVGAKAAGADSAKVVVTGTFRPAVKGRVVRLERKSGTKWVKAGTARQPKNGAVQFNAAYLAKGKPVTYRLHSIGSGAKPTVSKSVATSEWTTKQLFSDEFAGSALDAATWATREQDYGISSLRRCSRVDAGNATAAGGVARLTVSKDPAKAGTCSYKGKSYVWRHSGMIGTQDSFSFKYGYAAARMKFQDLRGQHAAFWLQPASRSANHGRASQTGAEIDVIEWFGNGHPNGGLSSYVYSYPKPGTAKKSGSWIKDPQQYGNKWSKKYHVFSVKWTPSSYTFYIDGKVTNVVKEGVSGQPQFLILSLIPSDYELPYLPSEKRLPQTASADWVRVWRL